MNKTTIELQRRNKFPYSYGRISNPWNESAILDAIVEWSQKPENSGCRVYRHTYRYEFENIENDGELYHGTSFHIKEGIPYCDLVDYLDIYYQ